MKKQQSEKARAASKRNLANWEVFQAMTARLSDNKKMLSIGFAIGSVVILVACFVGVSVTKIICTM